MACWMVTRWLSPLLLEDILVVDDDDRLRRVVERHMVVKAAAVVLLRNMRVGGNILWLWLAQVIFSSRGEKIAT